MKMSSTIAGFIYGFISMILAPLALVSLNNYLRFPDIGNNYTQLVGISFITCGGLLLIYATSLFAKHGKGGSPLPFDPPRKLVNVGAYKYIRNPMFTASALIWFGEFFFLGSFLLLPYAIVWILFNHIHLVAQDEKWLEKRYGKEYLEYKSNTPRYIPKFTK